MSGHQRYQDVTDAELARERRYEHRKERAAKVERKRRLADLRMAEELAADLEEAQSERRPVWYHDQTTQEALVAWIGVDVYSGRRSADV